MARGFGGAGHSGEGDEPCPCGGGAYASCCAPLIEAGQPANTAEQLMRSRYSAFARASRCPRAIDHLLRTHPEPGLDPRERRRQLQASARAVQWLGLSVLATEAGGPEDATGTVTFEARWRSRSGETGVMRECSRFGRGAAGEWLYLEPISEPIS